MNDRTHPLGSYWIYLQPERGHERALLWRCIRIRIGHFGTPFPLAGFVEERDAHDVWDLDRSEA